jgi:flagellar biosynthesis GTPase FlhF
MHDDVVSSPEVKRRYNFKIKQGKFFATENVDLTEGEDDMFGNRTKTQTDKDNDERSADEKRKQDAWEADEQRKKEAHQAKMDKEKRERDKWTAQQTKDAEEKIEKEKEREKQEKIDKAKRAKAEVKVGDNKAMSIEPTYMTTEITDRDGIPRKEFIGIKVVPFRVKSDEKLSRLILHDTQLSN